MDPSQTLNAFIVVALVLLAVSALLVTSTVSSLRSQVDRTLYAWEKLAETLQTEIKPTLTEAQQVLASLNQLRSATAERVTEVGHKVEDVAGSFGHAAENAKKQSGIWGAGLLAGVKAYLSGRKETESLGEDKQITCDTGDENVQLSQ